MSAKIVIIAATKEEGESAYPTAAAIVTPRTPDAAKGIAADRVLVMNSMREHEKLAELREGIRDARGEIADPPREIKTRTEIGRSIGHVTE